MTKTNFHQVRLLVITMGYSALYNMLMIQIESDAKSNTVRPQRRVKGWHEK
jgi:hypothetical protein